MDTQQPTDPIVHCRRLENRTAIVTGGANGIGKAIVRRLLAEGANVVIADRDEKALASTAGEISEFSAKILSYHADVRHSSDTDRVVAGS